MAQTMEGYRIHNAPFVSVFGIFTLPINSKLGLCYAIYDLKANSLPIMSQTHDMTNFVNKLVVR